MQYTTKITSFVLLLVLFLSGCEKKRDQQGLDKLSQTLLIDCNRKLTDIIITDIFTPPVASRIYAYANIAAYEAMVPSNPNYISLEGQVNGLKNLPKPVAGKAYYYPLASMIAFYTVAEKLVFAEKSAADARDKCLEDFKKLNLEEDIMQNSIAYGTELGKHMLKWTKDDGYIRRQSMSRYVLLNTPGSWVPTPPDYMPAVEPNWRTMRTFVLDSAAQFKPERPTPFDTVAGSRFHNEAMEVYNTVKAMQKSKDTTQLAIGKFWDCNPNISYTKGHVMMFHQKISPGGHWLAIAAIVAKIKNLDMMQTSEAFARVSIALADGFISCWDEKYRSNSIRPETYIEKYIDPTWDPLLQTPPFPEYPSGHSVVSGAAATVLTDILGDSIAYTDTTEVRFGMPARSYTSFNQASEEASISRLYGGIHFRPALENGLKQGQAVGAYLVSKLHTRKDQPDHRPLAQE